MKKTISFYKSFITFLYSFFIPTVAHAQVEKIQQVTAEQIDTAKDLIQLVMEFFVKYSFQAFGGLIILILGWLIARYIGNLVSKFLEKKNVDVTVSKFLVSTVKLAVIIFAAIVALGKFGIEIAPLIAGLSVVGFGTSFALQGPLSNYASGATLIFTKPFKVGDIIEVAGVTGEVVDLKLPRTEVRALDGELIVIPNKHIIGEIIQNYSDLKRLDVTVGVSYKADVDKAISIVQKILKNEEKVSKVKDPKVGISEFADSSVNIYARLWGKQSDYLDLKFSINKKIFDEFNKQGIEIPFPQRDVHIFNEN